MKVVFFILLAILVIFILLIIRTKFKVLLLFHLKNKSAYYTLNNRLFTLIQGKVLVLEDGQISVMIKKNKLLKKQTEEGFGEAFFSEIIKKIKLERLDVYVDQGKFGSEMTTALLSGGAKSIAGIVSAILNNKDIETKFHMLNTENKNELSVAVNTNIKISLLGGLVSYLRAKKKLKQLNEVKEKSEEYAKG